MVWEILSVKALPVSLDHDGVLVMLPEAVFSKDPFDTESIVRYFQLNGKFKEWSAYLLKEELPIEVKRVVFKGRLQEF